MTDNVSSPAFDLAGLRMRVASIGSTDGIGPGTVFTFSQRDGAVWARYSGGNIVQGFLIGTITGASLDFDYIQMTKAGRRDAGKSQCVLSRSSATGLISLTEKFQWSSRAESGENVFEEIWT